MFKEISFFKFIVMRERLEEEGDLHHDGLPGDLLPGPGHPQDPRDPLQEDCPNLHITTISQKICKLFLIVSLLTIDILSIAAFWQGVGSC